MFVCVLCSNVNRFEFDANVNFSINNFHVNYIYTCKFILSIFLSIFPTLFFLYPAFLIESRIVLSLRIEKKTDTKLDIHHCRGRHPKDSKNGWSSQLRYKTRFRSVFEMNLKNEECVATANCCRP